MTREQSIDRWRAFGEACRAVARLQLLEDRVAVLRALGALGVSSVEMMANVILAPTEQATSASDSGAVSKDGGR